MKYDNAMILSNIMRERFIIDKDSREMNQDDTGNTGEIIFLFFKFLKERGYTVRKYSPEKNVEYRDLKDYLEVENYNLSIFINEFSMIRIKRKKIHSILDFDNEGRTVFKIFFEFLSENHPDKVKKFITPIDLIIFFTDYVFYLLHSIRYGLVYSYKSEKISLEKEIKEYNEKIMKKFSNMLK